MENHSALSSSQMVADFSSASEISDAGVGYNEKA